jgi:hypothetical protein
MHTQARDSASYNVSHFTDRENCESRRESTGPWSQPWRKMRESRATVNHPPISLPPRVADFNSQVYMIANSSFPSTSIQSVPHPQKHNSLSIVQINSNAVQTEVSHQKSSYPLAFAFKAKYIGLNCLAGDSSLLSYLLSPASSWISCLPFPGRLWVAGKQNVFHSIHQLPSILRAPDC